MLTQFTAHRLPLILMTIALAPAYLRADEEVAKSKPQQADQSKKSDTSPTDVAPERLGFVDMAYIFKNYKKFTIGHIDIKKNVAESSLKVKLIVGKVRQLEAAVKDTPANSAERRELEQELIGKRREAEDFNRVQRQSLTHQESQLYKTVYLEVLDVVRNIAEQKHFTVVMRFDRRTVNDKTSTAEMAKIMNQLVVYYTPDHDLTDQVLERLNTKYVANVESTKKQ